MEANGKGKGLEPEAQKMCIRRGRAGTEGRPRFSHMGRKVLEEAPECFCGLDKHKGK